MLALKDRSVPQILLPVEPLDDLRRHLEAIHARAIKVLGAEVDVREFEPWQVRACVWVLDTRTLGDTHGPQLYIPRGLKIKFEPDPRACDIRKEKVRAEDEGRLRFHLDQGLVGRSYRSGDALAVLFGIDDTLSQIASDHREYGLTPDQIANLHPGLRWIVSLPLKARDRERHVDHVIGVLALDGVYLTLSENAIVNLGKAIFPEATAFAHRLASVPKSDVSLGPGPYQPLRGGLRALHLESEFTDTERALERIGESDVLTDLNETAYCILDFVDNADSLGEAAASRAREALVNQLGRRWDSSEWRHALILAAEEVNFDDDALRERLRGLLMISANHYRDLCSVDGPSAEPGSRAEREDVLLSALRRGTSLTPPERVSETADWLSGFLNQKQSPRVRQCSAQCLQNLYSCPPPTEEQLDAIADVRDNLASLAQAAIAGHEEAALGGMESAVVQPSPMAAQLRNYVHALGIVGDPRCKEIALAATEKFPHLQRSLIRHLGGTIKHWEQSLTSVEADDRRVVGRLREACDALQTFAGVEADDQRVEGRLREAYDAPDDRNRPY